MQEGQCCGHVSGSRTKKFILKRWGSSRRGHTCSTNTRKLTSIIRVPGEWSELTNWTALLTGWADRPLVAGTGERSRRCCWADEQGAIWATRATWAAEFIHRSLVFTMVIINYCHNFLGRHQYWYLIFTKKISFSFKDHAFWIVYRKKNAQTLYVYIDILDIYHIDFMEEYFVEHATIVHCTTQRQDVIFVAYLLYNRFYMQVSCILTGVGKSTSLWK